MTPRDADPTPEPDPMTEGRLDMDPEPGLEAPLDPPDTDQPTESEPGE